MYPSLEVLPWILKQKAGYRIFFLNSLDSYLTFAPCVFSFECIYIMRTVLFSERFRAKLRLRIQVFFRDEAIKREWKAWEMEKRIASPCLFHLHLEVLSNLVIDLWTIITKILLKDPKIHSYTLFLKATSFYLFQTYKGFICYFEI